MLRALLLVAALVAAGPGAAQDRARTLADMRAELGALGSELAALRAELVTTGAVAQFGGADALARLDAMEEGLRGLTAQTEDLALRIDRVVADGTNRIGDLEYRVVELEGGDVTALGQTPLLGATGGETGAPPVVGALIPPEKPFTPLQPVTPEKADLDRAREVLGRGDFRAAADLLAAHAATWPAGELIGEANYLRGQALDSLGETREAARAYLESFSGNPDGPFAPDALFRLGLALGTLGQRAEACVTLGQVGERYPGAVAAGQADEAMGTLRCQ